MELLSLYQNILELRRLLYRICHIKKNTYLIPLLLQYQRNPSLHLILCCANTSGEATLSQGYLSFKANITTSAKKNYLNPLNTSEKLLFYLNMRETSFKCLQRYAHIIQYNFFLCTVFILFLAQCRHNLCLVFPAGSILCIQKALCHMGYPPDTEAGVTYQIPLKKQIKASSDPVPRLLEPFLILSI